MITLSFAGSASAATPRLDFRIVLDASVRMQSLDPANRLESAVKMINGLLPEGARAGIWTYGRYVEMVARWGRVEPAWRQQADLAVSKIRSNSRLTNLDQALARARVGWQKPDPGERRVLLLVSAGGVRLSNDSSENATSRERVLGKGIAALRAAGAEVHALALGAESDAVLLQRLAIETGGIYRHLDDARELLEAFYAVYARVHEPDRIRLDGNDFRLDDNVSQLRLLLFNANQTRPALLVPPDSPAISAAKPRRAIWRSGDGFDLVQIDRPEAGNWRIDGDMHPANRLLVESRMELRVSGIPVRGTPREGFTVAAELFLEGRKIRRNAYLRFVDFRLTHIDVDGSETEYPLVHTDVRQDKGRFLFEIEPGLGEGLHRFRVSATSSSFDRRKDFATEIEWPAEIGIHAGAEPGQYRLQVRARRQYLDPAGMVVEAEITAPGGERERVQLEATADGALQAAIQTRADGLHQARVMLSAQSHRGEIVDLDLDAISFVGVNPVAAVVDGVVQNGDGAAAGNESGFNRKLIGFIIIGFNLTLVLVLLAGWLILRRRKARAAENKDEPGFAVVEFPAGEVSTEHGFAADSAENTAPAEGSTADGEAIAAVEEPEASAEQGKAGAQPDAGESSSAEAAEDSQPEVEAKAGVGT